MEALVIKFEEFINKITFKQISIAILFLKAIIICYFVYLLILEFQLDNLHFNSTFIIFIFVGFVAQIIDGALGMAYGVSCTTLLLNFGIPAKLASASVHTSEIFTTGVSGLSHIKFKNIDKKLFFKLVITGTLGAVLGAYLLADFFEGKIVKPFVSIYLLIIGFYILYKGVKNIKQNDHIKQAPLLALIGGFLDAIGGGGWGPIVTSNLLSQGKNPREAIGTVNTAEFFVTYFATIVFIIILGVKHWQIILGLILGGVLAAPLGAYIASKINKRILMLLVGLLIIITSSYTLYKTYFL